RRTVQVAHGAHRVAKRDPHGLFRPWRRRVQALEIRGRGEYGRGFHLVEGEEPPIAARHQLVASAEAEARHTDPLLQMLADVPALEMLEALGRAVVEHGKDAGRHDPCSL